MLHKLNHTTLRANSAVPSSSKASPPQQDTMPPTSTAQTPAKSDADNQALELEIQKEARVQSGESASSSNSSLASSAASQSGQNGKGRAGPGQPLRASLSKGACTSSQQVEGRWKVFDLAAVPIDETDPDTGGQHSAVTFVKWACTCLLLWGLLTVHNSGSAGALQCSLAGGCCGAATANLLPLCCCGLHAANLSWEVSCVSS